MRRKLIGLMGQRPTLGGGGGAALKAGERGD